MLRNKIGEITGAVRRLFLLPVEYLKIDFPSGFPTHTLSVWNLRPEQNRMHNNVSPQHPPLHQTRVRNCTKLSPLDRRGRGALHGSCRRGAGALPTERSWSAFFPVQNENVVLPFFCPQITGLNLRHWTTTAARHRYSLTSTKHTGRRRSRFPLMSTLCAPYTFRSYLHFRFRQIIGRQCINCIE